MLKELLLRVKPAFAFHNSELDMELYMYVSTLLAGLFAKDTVFKVEQGLYGLKQAPRLWYKTLVTWLFQIGFVRMILDPCLFLYRRNDSVLYLLVILSTRVTVRV